MNTARKFHILWLIWLLCAGMIMGAPPKELPAVIAARLNCPALKEARVGIVIYSLDDGTTWYSRNADLSFIPASNVKIITTALALENLGVDYRFITRLHTDGAVEDGVVHGNIILQGSGDPSLLPEDIKAMAAEMARGDEAQNRPAIREIRGKIKLDDCCFPRSGPLICPSWEKDDLPWYYGAPAAALACARNAVTVTVRGTQADKPPLVTVYPKTRIFKFVNRAMTRAGVKSGAITVTPKGSRVTIDGRVAPGVELTEKISVPDPAALAEEQLRDGLQAAGITLAGEGITPKEPARTLLAEHASAPLTELMFPLLKDSDNHTAEQLRWTLLGTKYLDTPLEKRFDALLEELSLRAGIIQVPRMTFVDGSGLSRLNKITPAQMAALLTYLAGAQCFTAFYDALPVAGQDGTLKKRMVGAPATGNARAKTGTIRGVCSLSGYVTTAGGERLVFSIFVNGYSTGAQYARELQDGIVNYLAGAKSVEAEPGE